MKRVFFVDDDGLLREMLARALEKESLQVRTFASPIDLLDILSGDQPEIIISDVQMPEMTGLELVEQIRKRWTTLPIILVSGHVTDAVKKEAKRLGVDHVLSKPIRDYEALATLIADTVVEENASDNALEGLDRLRMDFLTGLSHELRTPLTAIKLALDGLFSGHSGNGGSSRKLVEISQRNVDRLIRLVESQLDLLQITLRSVSVSRRLGSIQDIVNKASLVLPDGLPPTRYECVPEAYLFTDPDRLQSVLEYLFRNITEASSLTIRMTDDTRELTIEFVHTAIKQSVDRRATPELQETNGSGFSADGDFELRACQSLVESLGGTFLVSDNSGVESVAVSLPRTPAYDERSDLVLPLQSARRMAELGRETLTIMKCRVDRNGHLDKELHDIESDFLGRCVAALSDRDVLVRGPRQGEYYVALIGRSDVEVERVIAGVANDDEIIAIEVGSPADAATRRDAIDLETTV